MREDKESAGCRTCPFPTAAAAQTVHSSFLKHSLIYVLVVISNFKELYWNKILIKIIILLLNSL